MSTGRPAREPKQSQCSIASPLMRSAGYRRKGQEFEKQRHGYKAYVGFQKSVYNTRYDVSFTINVSVVNRAVQEEQMRAWSGAMAFGDQISIWSRGVVSGVVALGSLWRAARTTGGDSEAERR